MRACRTVQLVSGVSQEAVWGCHSQTHPLRGSQVACCPQTTSCCQAVAVHIVSCSCNRGREHTMTIRVDTYFNNIVCQTSRFRQSNQFMGYVILTTGIRVSCHNCPSGHEHIVQCVQHVYQIIASL